MKKRLKKRVRIRVAGPDHKGIIATVTQFIFQSSGNIEDIDQRNLEDYLVMNMLVDVTDLPVSLEVFQKRLKAVVKTIGMEATLKEEQSREKKNIALMVTKEPHCMEDLISKVRQKKINGVLKVIIANRPDLGALAKKHGLPFFCIPSERKKEHELRILKKLAPLDIDLIVLARYMQILSPEFVFRYEGKIINIHPSLLPAFPGPRSYDQAYNKGVEVVGVTAHFATTDLDEGPIICQEAFRVERSHADLTFIQNKGKTLEAKALSRAVKMFCEDRLVLRRGKVLVNKKEANLAKTTKAFYRS